MGVHKINEFYGTEVQGLNSNPFLLFFFILNLSIGMDFKF